MITSIGPVPWMVCLGSPSNPRWQRSCDLPLAPPIAVADVFGHQSRIRRDAIRSATAVLVQQTALFKQQVVWGNPWSGLLGCGLDSWHRSALLLWHGASHRSIPPLRTQAYLSACWCARRGASPRPALCIGAIARYRTDTRTVARSTTARNRECSMHLQRYFSWATH